jgi:MtN3 and saliva related transmembrane protein
MDATFWIGTLAAVFSAVSFAPQAWQIIRTRETHGISVGMYVITVVGFILWIIYGWLLSQWPIVLSNVICLGLAGFILTMKLLPHRQKEAVAATLDPGT